MLDTVIILAGGLGTRLKSVLPTKPKCLAPIGKKCFIDILIKYLDDNGIKNIIFSLGYKSELVINHLLKEYPNRKFLYSVENEQLGTGGAIKLAMKMVKSKDVLVINGDTYYNNDIKKFYQFYKKTNSNFTIALTKVENINSRFGSVEINKKKIVINFFEKINNPIALINAGHYIINKNFFIINSPSDRFSLELDFFQKKEFIKTIYGFEYYSDFIDIGIPEDFYKAQSILA